MRKIGILLLVSSFLIGWMPPVQAETNWDVTASGENPYTLSFTGSGTVTVTSDVELSSETDLTEPIDIEQTPTVDFEAATAPHITVTEEETGKAVALVFGQAPEDKTEEPAVPQEKPPVTTDDTPAVPKETKKVQVKQTPVKKPDAVTQSTGPSIGSINGTVWYDQNEDGIRQETEPLLDDVNVFLMNPNHDVLEAAITSKGRYTFSSVQPGTYLVKIDGYEIGLYTFTKKQQGDDRMLDSDVDQYGGTGVTMKNRDVVLDAGMTEGNEDIAESHFLTVTNFIDADHNQLPEMNESSVRATYSLLDTMTGEVLPAETVEAETALNREVPLGTYILKIELPAGYRARAIHQANYDSLEAEDGSVMEQYEQFVKGLKRTPSDAVLDLTQNRQGTVVVVEVEAEAVAPTVKPKPKPVEQPKPVQVTKSTNVSPAEKSTAQSETPPRAERLPQAGEEEPFPYALAGTGLATVGLWLLMRRGA